MASWTRTFIRETAPAESVAGDLWYKPSAKTLFIITDDGGATSIDVASRGIVAPTVTNAPAGGTGATGGAYDTSGNRDAMITALNTTLTTLRSRGFIA